MREKQNHTVPPEMSYLHQKHSFSQYGASASKHPSTSASTDLQEKRYKINTFPQVAATLGIGSSAIQPLQTFHHPELPDSLFSSPKLQLVSLYGVVSPFLLPYHTLAFLGTTLSSSSASLTSLHHMIPKSPQANRTSCILPRN